MSKIDSKEKDEMENSGNFEKIVNRFSKNTLEKKRTKKKIYFLASRQFFVVQHPSYLQIFQTHPLKVILEKVRYSEICQEKILKGKEPLLIDIITEGFNDEDKPKKIIFVYPTKIIIVSVPGKQSPNFFFNENDNEIDDLQIDMNMDLFGGLLNSKKDEKLKKKKKKKKFQTPFICGNRKNGKKFEIIDFKNEIILSAKLHEYNFSTFIIAVTKNNKIIVLKETKDFNFEVHNKYKSKYFNFDAQSNQNEMEYGFDSPYFQCLGNFIYVIERNYLSIIDINEPQTQKTQNTKGKIEKRRNKKKFKRIMIKCFEEGVWITKFKMSSTGRFFACTKEGSKKIKIVSVETGKVLKTLTRGRKSTKIYCMSFCNDDSCLAVTSMSGTFHIFNSGINRLKNENGKLLDSEKNKQSMFRFAKVLYSTDYFSSEWSFFKLNLSPNNFTLCHFLENNDVILIDESFNHSFNSKFKLVKLSENENKEKIGQILSFYNFYEFSSFYLSIILKINMKGLLSEFYGVIGRKFGVSVEHFYEKKLGSVVETQKTEFLTKGEWENHEDLRFVFKVKDINKNLSLKVKLLGDIIQSKELMNIPYSRMIYSDDIKFEGDFFVIEIENNN